MSPQKPSHHTAQRRIHASVLAALGDETRLLLLTRLTSGPLSGQRSSISQLTAGSRLTRQAITKHLRILEAAKIVRCTRSGRESLFEFDPKPVLEIGEYLNLVSQQWDQALLRLKSFVESK